MSQEEELELSRQFRAIQQKNSYFLLAASGAAIAFAMTQTKMEPLAWPHILWAVSIACWAWSFYSGLQFVEHVGSAIFQNHNFLVLKRLISGIPPDKAVVEMKDAKGRFDKTLARHEKKMKLHGDLQKYMLLCGAVFYFLWHALEMYLIKV